MIYKLRAKLIIKEFRTGKKSKVVLILDKLIDIYEYFKYRKMFKSLESIVKEREKLANDINEAIVEYKGLKIK